MTKSRSKIRWTAIVVVALVVSALAYTAVAYGGALTHEQPALDNERLAPVEPDGGIGDTPIPVEPDGGIGDTPIPVEPDGGIGNTPIPVEQAR